MRTIGDDERRARLARRHGLAPAHRFADVEDAADAIVALHATDPASVFLAARARLAEPSVAAIEAALYEQRTLVRMLGMRRTMFVVPAALAGVVQASSTRALIPGERKRFVALLEESGVADDGARWLRETEAATYAALVARGEATAVRARPGRPRAAREDAGRAGQALRRDPGRLDEGPLPARRRGADRARPPARLVDELAVSLGAGGDVAAGRDRRARRPTPPRPSCCAAGCWRSGPARSPT